MVEAVGAMSAMCVVGRFRADRGFDAPVLPRVDVEQMDLVDCC